METSLFDYHLPAERIAQTPAERRDQSRLLVYHRGSQRLSHHLFCELPDLLPARTTLYRNNATVLKARIRTTRPGGGGLEILLLHPAAQTTTAKGEEWYALLKPGKKLPVGSVTPIGDGLADLHILAKEADGQCRVRFDLHQHASVTELADALGEMPLPPYIRRGKDIPEATSALDRERYQTVFADPRRKVAAAAPTAGLHFTPELLEAVAGRGHRFMDLTLHVGLGTFKPVTAENIEEHPIHRERYEIPPATLQAVENPGTGTRLAIGTTSLRTLEDYQKRRAEGMPAPAEGAAFSAEADIFIYPPYTFRGADALLTNFHLPRSTLLALVSAFLSPGSTDGIKRLKSIYATAIEEQYRFYSYGDAMLILE